MRFSLHRVAPLHGFGWLVVVGCADAVPTDTDPAGTVLPDPETWPSEWAAFEDEVLRLVNQHRFLGGTCGGTRMIPSDPLEMDALLRAVARGYSQRMAEEGFFDHFDPQGRGPDDRVGDAGFTGAPPIGENIAQGYPTPEDVVDGWLTSPGHCTNMLEGAFGVIGIGYFHDEADPYGHWWTQNFAGSH